MCGLSLRVPWHGFPMMDTKPQGGPALGASAEGVPGAPRADGRRAGLGPSRGTEWWRLQAGAGPSGTTRDKLQALGLLRPVRSRVLPRTEGRPSAETKLRKQQSVSVSTGLINRRASSSHFEGSLIFKFYLNLSISQRNKVLMGGEFLQAAECGQVECLLLSGRGPGVQAEPQAGAPLAGWEPPPAVLTCSPETENTPRPETSGLLPYGNLGSWSQTLLCVQ